jgi:hypothetical protein
MLIKRALGDASEIKLGGVVFWFEGGEMIFDKPSSTWNIEAVQSDLIKALEDSAKVTL